MAFIDEHVVFGEGLQVGDASEWIDLGPLIPNRLGVSRGPGEPILVLVQGQGLSTDGSGQSAVNVRGRWDNMSSSGLEMQVYVNQHTILDDGVIFGLPTSIAPSIRLELQNINGGTWSAFIVFRVL
jgi:hypothetical protein